MCGMCMVFGAYVCGACMFDMYVVCVYGVQCVVHTFVCMVFGVHVCVWCVHV